MIEPLHRLLVGAVLASCAPGPGVARARNMRRDVCIRWLVVVDVVLVLCGRVKTINVRSANVGKGRNPRTRPCVRVPRARLLFADRSLEDVTEEYSRTRGTYCNVLIVSTVTLPLLYTRCAAVRLRFHTVTGVAGRRPGSSGHQQGMLVE